MQNPIYHVEYIYFLQGKLSCSNNELIIWFHTVSCLKIVYLSIVLILLIKLQQTNRLYTLHTCTRNNVEYRYQTHSCVKNHILLCIIQYITEDLFRGSSNILFYEYWGYWSNIQWILPCFITISILLNEFLVKSEKITKVVFIKSKFLN